MVSVLKAPASRAGTNLSRRGFPEWSRQGGPIGSGAEPTGGRRGKEMEAQAVAGCACELGGGEGTRCCVCCLRWPWCGGKSPWCRCPSLLTTTAALSIARRPSDAEAGGEKKRFRRNASFSLSFLLFPPARARPFLRRRRSGRSSTRRSTSTTTTRSGRSQSAGRRFRLRPLPGSPSPVVHIHTSLFSLLSSRLSSPLLTSNQHTSLGCFV